MNNALEITWLGQAGFLIRAGRTTVCIDPYLSDVCGRITGDSRLVPAPVTAADLRADVVLVTHEHRDHLDTDSISDVAAANPHARFIAPPTCVRLLAAANVPEDRCTSIARGEMLPLSRAVSVRAVTAHHTEDSVGYVVESPQGSVYHSGDTSYGADIATEVGVVDVALICVNGKLGNLTAEEAAAVVVSAGASHCVPMHWGMLARTTADPEAFRVALAAHGAAHRYRLPLLGQRQVFRNQT